MPERRARSIYLASRLVAAKLLAAGFSAVIIGLTSFEPEAICRAAIATIAGRDPKAMQVTRIVGDVLVSPSRPADR